MSKYWFWQKSKYDSVVLWDYTTSPNLTIPCRHFLILDTNAISIYTYTGRLHLTPKYSGLATQVNALHEKTISLGLHYVAVRDCADDSSESPTLFQRSLDSLFNWYFQLSSHFSDSYFWFGTRSTSSNWCAGIANENQCTANCC